MTITLVDDTLLSVDEDLLNLSISKLNSDVNEEIGNRVENNYDGSNYYKHLIVSQHEQINNLIKEIAFLREDSINKTIIINNLLAITRHNMLNDTEVNGNDCGNNTSVYNKNVSLYNQGVSEDNKLKRNTMKIK